MPDIKLGEEYFNNLYYSTAFKDGGEGKIFKSNQHTIYKFFDRTGIGISTILLEEYELLMQRKLAKIEYIYNLSDKLRDKYGEFNVLPLSTISCNGQLVGYEMTYDEDDFDLYKTNLKNSQKIKSLKRISDILIYYESLGIIYGDIADFNILINAHNLKPKFCDMDNIKIDGYDIDKKDSCLLHFLKSGGQLDERAHAFMLNLLTLHVLEPHLETRSRVLNYLKSDLIFQTIHKPYFFESPIKDIIKSMYNVEGFNGEHIIQYIKK